MKKFLSALLIGTMLSTSLPVYAEPPELPTPELVAGEKDVGAALSPMRRGQTAPFTGVLLSPRAAANITVELRNVEERIKIAIERQQAEDAAKCTAKVEEGKIKSVADTKVFQAQLDSANKQNSILTQRLLKEEQDRPNVLLWTSLGAAGGVVVTVLVVFATAQAQK